METRKPLRIGGVMRCCVKSLDDYEQAGGSQDEGSVVPCQYCPSALRVRDGAWEWYQDYRREA